MDSHQQSSSSLGRKSKPYLKIPKIFKDGGWVDSTRSTPSSPDGQTTTMRTASELSRSVNFLLNIHQDIVVPDDGHCTGSSGSSTEDVSAFSLRDGRQNGNGDAGAGRKASLQDTPKMLFPEEFRPRRSSMSRLLDQSHRRSPHSSASNLLTAVLSKTLRKK